MPKLRVIIKPPPEPTGDAERDVENQRDYLLQMSEELAYVLTHLEADNINDSTFERIQGMIPRPYTGLPVMDGDASAGQSEQWARGNHRHPHDTSKADVTALEAEAAAREAHEADIDNPHGVTAAQAGAIPNTATLDDISNGTTYAKTTAAQVAQIDTNETDIDTIEGKIPSEASASNQLADKAFVTDSITQGTAIFRGSFTTKAALLAVAWQTTDPDAPYYVSNNDYAVVLDDETQNDECWRYIYVTGTRWTPQYRINESPLTQAQLDALNSGATAAIINSVADKLDKTGDGKDVTATFTVASTRANISTGEKLSVLFGKIAKWFSDLGTAAWRAATGSVTSGSTDLVESGAVYTGLAGKQNKITANGILKGDGAGGVSAATPGTDYGTYSKPSGGIPASDLANGVIPTVPSAYTSNPAMDGTASPGSSGAWAKGDHVHPSDTSRAPANHASSGTTYGKGDASNYGHLKLSNSTSLNSGVVDGVAATPRAVKDTYDFAATKAEANSYTGTFASSSTTYVSSASVSDCKRAGMLVGLALSLSLDAQIPISRQTFGQLHGVPTPKVGAVGVMQIVNALFAVTFATSGELQIEAIGTAGGGSGWSGRVTIMYITNGTILA